MFNYMINRKEFDLPGERVKTEFALEKQNLLLCLLSNNRMKMPDRGVLCCIHRPIRKLFQGSVSSWDLFVCTICLAFYLYLVSRSLDPKAVKYSETNCEYTPEKLLASSICPTSNCPHCPNLQSTVDVVWESIDDALFPWCPHKERSVTDIFGLFPQVGRVASAVWGSSMTWFLLVLPSSFYNTL